MESRACFLFHCVIVSSIYKVVAQCGGSEKRINASEIYKIYTLRYPDSGMYGENLICSWILESFTHNQLLYISLTSLANGDFLEVYDGTSTSGTSLYLSASTGVSGLSLSILIPSSNSYLRFTSDGVIGANQIGFTVLYMPAVSDDKGGCSTTANVVATDTKQYLTSPNFPDLYPPDSSCSWNIETEDSCGSLVLDFILLDIESECSADKAVVTYDGNPSVDLCVSNDWDSSSDYNTTGNTAEISLSTDSSDQYRGFVMSYTRTDKKKTEEFQHSIMMNLTKAEIEQKARAHVVIGCSSLSYDTAAYLYMPEWHSLLLGCVTTSTETTTSTSNLITTTTISANALSTTGSTSGTLLHSTPSTTAAATTTMDTGTTATQTTSTTIYKQASSALSSESVGLLAGGGSVATVAIVTFVGAIIYRQKKKTAKICICKDANVS